jgi:hypothetical protein
LTKKPEPILQFKGWLTFEKIGILLNDLKNKKDSVKINPVHYKKLLTLMIELLENILKYSEHFEDFTTKRKEFLPEFELYQTKDSYILISRNPVRGKAKDIVTRKIEKLNNSDEEGLKKYYRETITNGVFTEKGGAGLGLIELSRITAQRLEYRFESIERGYSMFELQIRLNKTDN